MGSEEIMSEDKQITFRIGQQTHETIRYDLVPSSDRYDSEKQFVEAAVKAHSGPIIALASGGQQTRRMIRNLGCVRGFDEQEPSDTTSATIKGEQASEKILTIELADDRRGMLNDISDHTGLDSRSAVIRRCVFRSLNAIARQSDLLADWQERAITRRWTELQNGLLLPKHRFHEVLTRRFVIQYDATQKMIEQDPSAFDAFAEDYTDNFHGSKHYEQLVEIYGDRTFSDVESTIEEYSEYSVDRPEDTSGFLEEFDGI